MRSLLLHHTVMGVKVQMATLSVSLLKNKRRKERRQEGAERKTSKKRRVVRFFSPAWGTSDTHAGLVFTPVNS